MGKEKGLFGSHLDNLCSTGVLKSAVRFLLIFSLTNRNDTFSIQTLHNFNKNLSPTDRGVSLTSSWLQVDPNSTLWSGIDGNINFDLINSV